LLDEKETSKQAAASSASVKNSRKARKKEAQQEQERVERQAKKTAMEERETALAIAQVAKVVAKQAALLEKKKRIQEASAAKVNAEIARALQVLEIDVQRLEADSMVSSGATVNFLFDMIRAALAVAETEVAQKEIREQVVEHVVLDLVKMLEAHEVLRNSVRPQTLTLMAILLPDYQERERRREADRLEIIALRAVAEEVAALRAAAALEKEARECVVCLTNPRNVLLRECNHFCLCESCWDEGVKECPLCRAVVTSGEVYYS